MTDLESILKFRFFGGEDENNEVNEVNENEVNENEVNENEVNENEVNEEENEDNENNNENEDNEENEDSNVLEESPLRKQLSDLKKLMFQYYVEKDNVHDASESGALYKYYSIFLNLIAYWIGNLDDESIPKPELNIDNEDINNKLKEIDNYIASLEDSSDRQIAYYELHRISTQHPHIISRY